MGVRQLTLLKIYFEDRSNGGSFARLYYFLKPNFLVWSGRNFCYAPLRLRVGSRSLKGPSGRGTQIFAVEVQKIEQEEDEGAALPLSDANWIMLNEVTPSGRTPQNSPSR
jgi:hypothetical protein